MSHTSKKITMTKKKTKDETAEWHNQRLKHAFELRSMHELVYYPRKDEPCDAIVFSRMAIVRSRETGEMHLTEACMLPDEALAEYAGYLLQSDVLSRAIAKQPKMQPIQGEQEPENHRSYNVGDSDYSTRKIQPWDIWKEYNLNPWDADIVKRVLRNKKGQSREEEYRKIIHVCQERISQLQDEKDK